MATNLTGPLEFTAGCLCAGTGCGGHVVFRKLDINWTPAGYQGAAQHTWTMACCGHHGPGPCPPSQQPVRVEFGT
jgi:hypothetical protein